MPILTLTLHSNIPLYPRSWYWANGNFAAKTVSVATDRYKLTSPAAIQVDVGGYSLSNAASEVLDLSIDASWDFGQNVGTWAAGHSYAVGDWVRPSTSFKSVGNNNSSTAWATINMGANTSAGQVATSTSNFAGYSPFAGFEHNLVVGGWLPSNGNSGNLQIDVGYAKVINKYYVRGGASTNHGWAEFCIQGSNSSSAAVADAYTTTIGATLGYWTTLDYQVNQTPTPSYGWSDAYNIANLVAYRYYRVCVIAKYESYAEGCLKLVEAQNLLYRCTSPGTSLSTEPTWGTTVEATTQESIDEVTGPTWTCYYDDTVASNRAGVDFFIYSCVGTSASPNFVLSRNSTYPHGYDATNSRKIGGFHCLCASAGTIASHPSLSGYLTGDILPSTVWDLKKRASSLNNNGMSYIDALDDWWFIYPASNASGSPVSVFNATHWVSIDWNDAVDAGQRVGAKLPRDGAFQIAAALSNEKTTIYGSADPTTVGGHVDTNGVRMISRYGLEDCCGAMAQWLDEQSYQYGGSVAHTHSVSLSGDAQTATSGNASADISPTWGWYDLPLAKGQLYRQGTQGDVKLIAGGAWITCDGGPLAGSRCRYFSNYRRVANIYISFRLVSPNLSR
jgi:hypothetical protein